MGKRLSACKHAQVPRVVQVPKTVMVPQTTTETHTVMETDYIQVGRMLRSFARAATRDVSECTLSRSFYFDDCTNVDVVTRGGSQILMS